MFLAPVRIIFLGSCDQMFLKVLPSITHWSKKVKKYFTLDVFSLHWEILFFFILLMQKQVFSYLFQFNENNWCIFNNRRKLDPWIYVNLGIRHEMFEKSKGDRQYIVRIYSSIIAQEAYKSNCLGKTIAVGKSKKIH